MEKSKPLEDILKRLQELDKQIDNGADDEGELLSELNDILNGLSKELPLDIKNNFIPDLKYINKSNNPDPDFAYEGDSGFDLRAYLESEIEYHIEPFKFVTIPTGLYFEVEKGLEVQVRPRSGLADKFGIIILNTPGTIDSRYRGEVKVILGNLGEKKFVIKNGDRIAQGVVCPVYGEGKLNIVKVKKLSETKRNDSGFGSSGVK
jgi:dUTP pyrophosphatase